MTRAIHMGNLLVRWCYGFLAICFAFRIAKSACWAGLLFSWSGIFSTPLYPMIFPTFKGKELLLFMISLECAIAGIVLLQFGI